jgi:hypothetical protein
MPVEHDSYQNNPCYDVQCMVCKQVKRVTRSYLYNFRCPKCEQRFVPPSRATTPKPLAGVITLVYANGHLSLSPYDERSTSTLPRDAQGITQYLPTPLTLPMSEVLAEALFAALNQPTHAWPPLPSAPTPPTGFTPTLAPVCDVDPPKAGVSVPVPEAPKSTKPTTLSTPETPETLTTPPPEFQSIFKSFL